MNVCAKTVAIPVAWPAGPTLNVGSGQTYATIDAALQQYLTDPLGVYAGTTIQVHPGTYTDDLSCNTNTQASYLRGPVKFVGVLDGSGNRPLITYSAFPCLIVYRNAKGCFLTVGYDAHIENFEISRVRYGSDADGSSNYIGAVRLGDRIDLRKTMTSWHLKNCVVHDCDMAAMGGQRGDRGWVENCDVRYCGTGLGSSHNFYINPYSYFRMEGSLSYATSRGHLLKGRARSATVLNTSFINSNFGFYSACADICDARRLGFRQLHLLRRSEQ